MKVAVATLQSHRGGSLIVSGFGGEAESLAALAPSGVEVVLETDARSTFENVKCSLPLLSEAEAISIASDRFHVRKAMTYIGQLRPELLERTVPPARSWFSGWWIDAGGAAYELLGVPRRALWRLRSTRT